MKNSVVIQNRNLELHFEMIEGVFALSSLKTKRGEEFCCPGPGLWKVELIDNQNQIRELLPMTFPDLGTGQHQWRLIWNMEDMCSITVLIDLPEDSDQAELKIKIEKLSSDWSVRHVTFPVMDWALREDDRCKLILPDDSGAVYPNPLKALLEDHYLPCERIRKRNWPMGNFTMQFLALEKDGELAYFGAHDSQAAVKNFYYDCDWQKQCLNVRLNWPAARIQGQDHCSFPVVMALARGDWFNAAQRYRKFALTAPWLAKGALEKGGKTPEWMLKTPMVTLRMHRGAGNNAEDLKKEADFFQTPMLVHYYLWHKNAFDSGNPFFFPAVPGFRKELKKIQGSGLRVMPYVNFYSADRSIEEWNDLEASAVQTDENGTQHRCVWSQQKEFVQMCMAAPLWKRMASQQVLRLLETGVDGVYFDEMGMSPPYACCARNHKHVPGDPESFTKANNAFLEEIRQEAEDFSEELVFASEGAGEPFIRNIDSLLTGNGNNPYMQPLFSAVYHDYVMCFGRYVFVQEITDPKFFEAIESKTAQQFSVGFQFGWSRIPWNQIIQKSEGSARFIRLLAWARRDYWKYLACGKMLRSLELDVPLVNRRWAMSWKDQEGKKVTLPAVMNSVWQCDDASLAVALVNITDQNQPVKLTFPSIQMGDSPDDIPPEEKSHYYPMPQPALADAYIYSGDQCMPLNTQGNSGSGFCLTMPPKSVGMILIASEKPYGVHCF